MVSVALKRPAHKEQHLCADKAYDASEVREFAASEGYTTHIKVNPRKKDSGLDPGGRTDQSFGYRVRRRRSKGCREQHHAIHQSSEQRQ
jgi:hypothetical protein